MSSNNDMYSNKERELIGSIEKLDLVDVLKKETLGFNFVVNYILNEKYQKTRKEQDITIQTVINYQPHLAEKFKIILSQTQQI
jgi:hypothetical protein